jgi:hypothetical protein
MASYSQLETYWKQLASESDRLKLVDIGPTAEGRPQYMMIISSPANMKNLDHYKEISRKLALAQGLTDEEAHQLAQEGKAVVWIDGGLHASETVGSQQLMEMVYQMASRTDPETMRFLNDDMLLATLANPDGQELMANWYMRNPDPTKRSLDNLPRLFQKYVGHDNNRDFYMSNMPETTNINRQLFLEWFPQMLYNHQQTGPTGGVIFIPPFRDPFNYNMNPLIPLDIEEVGVAMHERLVAEGKGGSEMRTGANYSTCWNGGLRTVTYFHNMIGILTEIIGNPTPMKIPVVAEKQLPTGDWPLPIAPQAWHYRESIDYGITNNRAILDYASRNRETMLYNIYRMGADAIKAGSEDSWTITPKRIAALNAAAAKLEPQSGHSGSGNGSLPAGVTPGGSSAHIIPADLYNTVLHDPKHRDPRGYIIPSNQPDFPTAVRFINALEKNGVQVLKATSDFQVEGNGYPAGSYIVKTAQAFRPHVLDMFEPQDYPNGLDAYGLATAPTGEAMKLKPVHIGLYDQYGGLMPSGWTRWLFEQFEFPYQLVYPQGLDAGNLKSRFDVLVFTDGAVHFGEQASPFSRPQPSADSIPEQYRSWLGHITKDKTLPQIEAFVKAGGDALTIGSSTSMGSLLGVPASNYLTEVGRDENEHPLTPEQFYVPGSILRAEVDNTDPLAYGLPDKTDVFFDRVPYSNLRRTRNQSMFMRLPGMRGRMLLSAAGPGGRSISMAVLRLSMLRWETARC